MSKFIELDSEFGIFTINSDFISSFVRRTTPHILKTDVYFSQQIRIPKSGGGEFVTDYKIKVKDSYEDIVKKLSQQ